LAEAEYLARAAAGANVRVVPWTVPLRQTTVPRAARLDTVSFIGGFRHPPNPDAARWLVNEIMPLVWREHPRMQCVIAGSDWPEDPAWLTDERVRLVGQFDRLSEVLDATLLTVAPLRFGAGVKGKVLDSMAAGVPCVMSSIAAEGIPLDERLRDLVADDAVSIAARICGLRANDARYQAYSLFGMAMIAEQFSAEVLERAIEACLPPAKRPDCAATAPPTNPEPALVQSA
jgi:glycosyltransferase involved in cell wall biosynthesis